MSVITYHTHGSARSDTRNSVLVAEYRLRENLSLTERSNLHAWALFAHEHTDPVDRVLGAFWESVLSGPPAPDWLQMNEVAHYTRITLHALDHVLYHLDAYAILPERLHLALVPLADDSMAQLLRCLPVEAGSLHEPRSGYRPSRAAEPVAPRYSAPREAARTVIHAPVDAGYVTRPEEWPWGYLKGKI
jgi:hypothetical protein